MLEIGSYCDLPVGDIVVPEHRVLRHGKATVETIKESIAKLGQLQPVGVTRVDDHWRLVWGATRLAAMKELGRTEITAVVVKGDSDDAHQAEIAENYCRARYSPAELKKLREAAKRKAEEQLAADAKASAARAKAAKVRKSASRKAAKSADPVSGAAENPPIKNKGGRPRGGEAQVARELGVPRETLRDARKADQPAPAPAPEQVQAEAPKPVVLNYLAEARRLRDDLVVALKCKLDSDEERNFQADEKTKELIKVCSTSRPKPTAELVPATQPEAA
jgi:ParB-like chromosome segregation protein Spo0J